MPELLLLGHFPPPRGGVAAHLGRLRDRLLAARYDVRCVSFGDLNPAHPETLNVRHQPLRFLLALVRGARLLHYHTDEGDWKSAALLGMWCAVRGQRYVLTLHSFRDHRFLHVSWSRWIVQRAYRGAAAVICISENLRGELQSRMPVDPARLRVIPSFIAPTSEESRAPVHPAFEALSRRCPAIIAFNAFAPTLLDGKDLYGAGTLLDAFDSIREEFPEAGLFMAYMRMDDSPNAIAIRKRAAELGDRVVLVEQRTEPFIPALVRSHVFVRATLNDGGPSLSVLEALSLGVWCAASDAVPRPAECALFKTGDAQDLARVLRELLERVRQGEKQQRVHFPDAADELIEMYNAFPPLSAPQDKQHQPSSLVSGADRGRRGGS